MPNLKQFISSHKIISIIIALIVVTMPISTIAFFKNKTSNSASQVQLQLISSQSSVISSSSSNSSSVSRSSVVASSSIQVASSSTNSEIPVKETYVPATVTPVIPKNIDTSNLGFVKSFAQTANTPATKVVVSETKTNSKVVTNPNLDFNKADLDYMLAESQKLIDTFDKADINNPDSFKTAENPKLNEISTKVTKFQREYPEDFEKQFPGVKSKMDGLLTTLIDKAVTKFTPKIVEGLQEAAKKGGIKLKKCKEATRNGYEYKEISQLFESINAKMVVYNSGKGNLERIVTELKANCDDGNYTFYDSQATVFDNVPFPMVNYDDNGKIVIPENYKHYLGSIWINQFADATLDYYPDYLAKIGYQPEINNNVAVIMLK
jgi:signal recognition particle subunit SEC65